ncbi:hypothetical protein B0J13DRAFT_622763 [Dactylonectria estremocensis]|uniref:C2H2-type domain-containing protein n=1 Tax=Dactylonectria estremocensis TaxID=1079267 RepID=A0A9P9EUM7_9HYPO|nr:hypothetical protein B0J13DRAFT_622763 [Dactylonectria estremocensis]
MTYYINNDQVGYKIEYPFSYIKNIFLENNEGDPSKLSGIVVELNRPPNFFMDAPPSTSGFFQCGDFTEHQQASLVLTHSLGGNPRVLSGQLAKLVSLPSFLNRHYHEPHAEPSSRRWAVDVSRRPVIRPAPPNTQIYAGTVSRSLDNVTLSPGDFLQSLDGFHKESIEFTNLDNEVKVNLGRAGAQAGSRDGDFESRLTELRLEQEASKQKKQQEALNYVNHQEASKHEKQLEGREFLCETCGYFPRGNPKYFKQSLAKHMKRHAAKKSGPSSRQPKEENMFSPAHSGLLFSQGASPRYLQDPYVSYEWPANWAKTDKQDLASSEDERLVAYKTHLPPPLDDYVDAVDENPGWTGPSEVVAFTDSGYASALNPNEYLNSKPSTGEEASPDPNTSLAATIGIDNDDTATLYSAGTTVAPARAQTYIAEICNDIYGNLKDCVNAETWPVVSKVLPDLIKAFAIRLGNDYSVQVNRDIMYFVHQRHREVISQLEAMFSRDDEEPLENCRHTLEGMPLLDKMSLWRSRDNEDAASEVEADEYFYGVKDDEDQDDHIENIGLSVYQKVITDSQAYKWFLATCKKEVSLQQEATKSGVMTNESIRRSLMEKLPTGTISKRHSPSNHEVAFILEGHRHIALRLECDNVEPASWSPRSFSDFVVLTGSANQAQALTIEQYMCQTWPENGLQMLKALKEGMEKPKNLTSGKSPANTPLVVGKHGTQLLIKAIGPAYFIAECAEQLAWLQSAVSTVCGNGICGVTPLVDNINVKPTTPQSSSYRGTCQFVVDLTAVFDADPVMPSVTQSSWQAVVGRQNIIQGYPIARRPEGYMGLELSFNMLLCLMQAKEISFAAGKVVIKGPQRSLVLKGQTDGICLWHPLNTIADGCFCNQGSDALNDLDLEQDRHILGSCRSQDFPHVGDDAYSINTRPPDSTRPSNAAESTPQSILALGKKRPQPLRRRRARQEVEGGPSLHDIRHLERAPVLKYHASATPMTLPRSRRGSQSGTATDSSDDSFDTDQLSISDSSEHAERLTVNDPLYPVLRNVLFRLLSGYITRQRNPSSAQQSGQGASASASSLSTTDTGGLSIQNNSKRKRGNDDSDGAGQDGFQRPPHKKINCDPAEKRSFACPFLKKDPVEHRDCCTRKLSRIRDVKQHLARRHTPERYCQLCFETSFADQRSLQNHISERSCLSQDPSMLEGISYDQRQQLSKKSNPNISEEGQWFAIWDIIFPESLKPTSAYIDTGLSVEMRLFREYSQTHGPAMIREQIMASSNCVRLGSSEEDQQSALDRVIAEGITRMFETWRSAQSAGSRLSRNQANGNQQAGQATPLSSVADSGFATASQVSSLEAGSRIEGRIEGRIRHPDTLEIPRPPLATETAAEGQASRLTHDLTIESPDPFHQDWLGLLANMGDLGSFNANGNEFGFSNGLDSFQGNL